MSDRNTRMMKDKCFTDIQEVLCSVPSSERFVILGDFNARVASRSGPDDKWGNVCGPHGIGECNSAGQELLSFLDMNNATICNTWFCKKPQYYQTWRHLANGKWHAIDFIIVHQRD